MGRRVRLEGYVKSNQWMISPANEAQDEVVCKIGYEKNFPEHSFIHVIKYEAYKILELENAQLKHNMLGFDSEADYKKRISDLESEVVSLETLLDQAREIE